MPYTGKTIVPAMAIKVTSYKHDDTAEHRLVCCIETVNGVATGSAYKVTKDDVATLVGRTNALGKDDSVSGVVYSNGDVRVDVSEADAGGSGSTCAIRTYTFPAAFPPSATASGSGAVDSVARIALRALLTGLSNVAQVLYATCQNIIKTLP